MNHGKESATLHKSRRGEPQLTRTIGRVNSAELERVAIDSLFCSKQFQNGPSARGSLPALIK